jgi:hypothetical protein
VCWLQPAVTLLLGHFLLQLLCWAGVSAHLPSAQQCAGALSYAAAAMLRRNLAVLSCLVLSCPVLSLVLCSTSTRWAACSRSCLA